MDWVGACGGGAGVGGEVFEVVVRAVEEVEPEAVVVRTFCLVVEGGGVVCGEAGDGYVVAY